MNKFRRAVARVCGVHVSLLRDMVQCVSRRLLWCPCDVVFLWLGRCAGCCARDTMPPSPEGQQPASRHTGHSVPTSRAHPFCATPGAFFDRFLVAVLCFPDFTAELSEAMLLSEAPKAPVPHGQYNKEERGKREQKMCRRRDEQTEDAERKR